MTGGTQWAGHINQNLARACRDFGLGMGLGSCRGLLNSNDHLADFQVRGIMGDDLPLYANLGIAQVEQLVSSNALGRISELLDKLEANGLIVHINPMQEWLQPEGDTIARPPIETLNALLEKMDIKLIVKEVGQGMGPKSLRALFQMPLAAIDFAASGGTNFAKLEMLRSNEDRTTAFEQLSLVGHSPVQMVEFANQIFLELGAKALCRQVIISGGIQNFLDGYYLTNKLHIPCVYGQASAFLRHARGPYDALYRFVDDQIKGLELTHNYLDII